MTTDAEIFEARWEGVTDLDQEAMDAGDLDGLVFAVVAYRVAEAGGTRFIKGKRRRKDVFHIEEFRVMTGDARSNAVSFLAAKQSADTLALDAPKSDDDLLAAITELKRAANETWNQDDEFFERDDEPVVSVPSVLGVDDVVDFDVPFEPVQEVGSVNDYKKTATAPTSKGGDGPKIAKFNPDDVGSAAPTERQVVGSVYRKDYQRKDKVLQKFMEQD